MELTALGEFINVIMSRGLSPFDCCIVGGGALSYHGIRSSRCIDFVCGSRVRREQGFDEDECQLSERVRLLPKDFLFIPTGLTDDKEVYHSSLYCVSEEGIKFVCREILYLNVSIVLNGMTDKGRVKLCDAVDSRNLIEILRNEGYNKDILSADLINGVKRHLMVDEFVDIIQSRDIIALLDLGDCFCVDEGESFWD